MSRRPAPISVNPVLLRHAQERRKSWENLEAIFLSTFVLISQNRADEKRQVLADQQWQTVQDEEQQNEELLRLSNQILELTKAIHATSAARAPAGPPESDGG